MNSLRSRQLISSFAILMVSIFILGSLLYMFTQQRQMKAEQGFLEELGFDLLGYISYDNGKFVVNTEHTEEFTLFLKKNNLSNGIDSMAYIQSTNTSIIHWHSMDPYNDLSAVKRQQGVRPIDSYLVTFPIRAEPGSNYIETLAPETRNSQDNSVYMHAEKYITYAYGFQHDKSGEFQLVIARTALHMITDRRKMFEHLVYLFIISALLVLLLQLATSYWVIAPIKDFDEEIKRIEAGTQESITNTYPEELEPVKNTINALLQFEKGQKRRFRDSLDDLAHSLKTPLAAMNNFLTHDPERLKKDEAMQGIMGQLNRMKEIISYQLRKAIVSNQNALATPLKMRPVLTRLRDSLYKVHHEKSFTINVNVEDNLVCRMDEDDMMELFGNLMNNACRFCDEAIDVSARQDGDMVIVDIDDDGMGFPDANPARLLQRGIRHDSETEGQGIGLAVSTEIVATVGGKIELLVSPQVGARVRLHLPS